MEKNFFEDTGIEIDFLGLWEALKKRMIIIILMGLIGASLSYVVTKTFITEKYRADKSMLILTTSSERETLYDVQMGKQLTDDYKALITCRPVLNKVLENVNSNISYTQLKSMIHIENPENTRMLIVMVYHENPLVAYQLVNEIVTVGADYIAETLDTTTPKIIEDSVVPSAPSSPNVTKNVILGFAIGFILCCMIIVMYTLMDDTIKTEEDVEKYLGLPTLSSVPDRNVKIKKHKESKKG